MRQLFRTVGILLAAALIGAVAPGVWSAASAAGFSLKTLNSFCSNAPTCSQGVNPESGLIIDSGGNLYGTTVAGGLGYGTVFEMARAGRGYNFKLLYKFCSLSACNDGISPNTALVTDTAGNLYGVASAGGPNSAGVVFELSFVAKRWTYKVLYAFCSEVGCADGAQPSGTDIGVNVNLTYNGAASGQAYDGVSPLYGTTEAGGAQQSGTVFSLTGDPNWTAKVLYNFCSQPSCADGSEGGNLIYDGGLLYGTTASGHGSIFRLTSARRVWSRTTLYAFCPAANCADGDVPNSLVLDGAGNLFGSTSQGGTGAGCQISAGCGVAFKLVPKSKRALETVLYNFCSAAGCSDGAQPAPGVALDSAGNLYGATNLGGFASCLNGSTCGVVFEIGAGSEQVLHAFCAKLPCVQGTSPDAGPILDRSGNLFGTTAFGGQYGGGTTYELSPPN